jgi:hypothetical protein
MKKNQSSKVGSNKVRQSLIRPKPLKREYFKTLQQRDAYILEMRYEGYTLDEIGESVGLTRESIRLIVKKKNGPTQQEVLNIRKAKYRSEVMEVITEESSPTKSSITTRLAISQSKLTSILGNKTKNIPGSDKSKRRIYSDDDLLKILKSNTSLTDQPLSATKYMELCGEPTVAVFIARFGSWKNACELAGVRSGDGRENYSRKHTTEDMLAFVESYLADPRTSGSAQGYDNWQRQVEGAPSLALLRQRLGKWNDIKQKILKP